MNIMNQFAYRNLKKNRTRTFVTILGIILSTALFTAVTESVISGQHWFLDYIIETEGAWEGLAWEVPEDTVQKIQNADGVKATSTLRLLGYSRLEQGKNTRKPYLCIQEVEKNYASFLEKIKLQEGRMAKNEGELVISEHAADSGNFHAKIGDMVTIQAGERVYQDGTAAGNEVVMMDEKGNLAETLRNVKERTYKIVGYCKTTSYENSSLSPGYFAFTMGGEAGISGNVYLKMKDGDSVSEVLKRIQENCHLEQEQCKAHRALLMAKGAPEDPKLVSVMYTLGAILTVMIMIASVSMIYNAFAISMSQRTKMYGLLKSVGATKKQIRSSVLFEAMALCAVGIPAGVGIGLFGTGILLKYAGFLFDKLLTEETDQRMHLVFSCPAVLAAVLLGGLTVLISAWIPALRVVRMPAIEALRQSRDIKMNPSFRKRRRKSIYAHKVSYKLFGFAGELARINFNRNRKRQRTIVSSLAVSIILFLAASSVSSYFQSAIDTATDKVSYDVQAFIVSGEWDLRGEPTEMVAGRLREVLGAEDCSYSTRVNAVLTVSDDEITDKAKQLWTISAGGKKAILETSIWFIEDKGYRKFLEENHLDTEKYMSTEKPCPLFDDFFKQEINGKHISGNFFKKDSFSGELTLLQDRGGALRNSKIDKKGRVTVEYEFEKEGGEDEEETSYQTEKVSYPLEKAGVSLDIGGNERWEGLYPLGSENLTNGGTLGFMLPYSALSLLPEDFSMPNEVSFGIKAKKHAGVSNAIGDISSEIQQELNEYFGRPDLNAVIFSYGDYAANVESVNAIVWIIRIFSYGFIGIISLIILANVFNTISTGITLRRQEFAMLKSVGMSDKDVRRLVNYECLIYGLKGFFYGIPIALGLTYLLYYSLKREFEFGFYIPVYPIPVIISIVFAIVFFSMLYAMRRMQDENPMEALRNEVI